MLTWLLAVGAMAAPGATLVDPTPTHDGPPVLVVQTPGFAVSAMYPLLDAVQDQGWDPMLLAWSCRGQTLSDYAAGVSEALAALPEGTPVVAHGLGATAALSAGGAERYVLLAPLLSVVPQALTRDLATLDVPEAVLLSAPHTWRDRSTVEVLLGAAEWSCLPGPLLREAQGWVGGAPLPLDLASVDVPVWIGVSGEDALVTSESVVAPSRLLPQRTFVRLGLNRLDPEDYDHAELLTDAVPTRAAARALGAP